MNKQQLESTAGHKRRKAKKYAIDALKNVFKQEKRIELKILDKAASWKGGQELSFDQAKHIGYVSALAWAYDIKEMELNKNKKEE